MYSNVHKRSTELLVIYPTVLLPEHRGRSPGTSDPTQKTAPSAGNHCDLQYIPGFALRPALPSHTVSHLISPGMCV